MHSDRLRPRPLSLSPTQLAARAAKNVNDNDIRRANLTSRVNSRQQRGKAESHHPAPPITFSPFFFRGVGSRSCCGKRAISIVSRFPISAIMTTAVECTPFPSLPSSPHAVPARRPPLLRSLRLLVSYRNTSKPDPSAKGTQRRKCPWRCRTGTGLTCTAGPFWRGLWHPGEPPSKGLGGAPFTRE